MLGFRWVTPRSWSCCVEEIAGTPLIPRITVEFPVLCRAHIQVDALNRQALVSVVYIQDFGIDGYCPKCILLLTVLLPEIACQIRPLHSIRQLGDAREE